MFLIAVILLNQKAGRKLNTDCILIDSMVTFIPGNVSHVRVTRTRSQRIETFNSS